MFNCKKCGLIISEKFNICPKCSSNDSFESYDCHKDTFYKLTRDDVESAIERMSEEDAKIVESIPMDEVLDFLRRKFSMPDDEYIVTYLECEYIYKQDEQINSK